MAIEVEKNLSLQNKGFWHKVIFSFLFSLFSFLFPRLLEALDLILIYLYGNPQMETETEMDVSTANVSCTTSNR